MYLIKKAGKNLLKNKGRNTVVFLMLGIVILALVIALTIFNVTQQIGVKTKNYYSGEVSIQAKETASAEEMPTIEDYKRFVQSEYLRSYAFYRFLPVNISALKLFDDEYVNGNQGSIMPRNARAYSLLDEMSIDDFSYGERKITSGNFPSSETECMISSALAELNGLTLGDTIKVTVGMENNERELTISGIYLDETVERRQANHRHSSLNARNDVITNYSLLEFIDDPSNGAALFLLENPNDLEAFQAELYSKGLSENFYLAYDTDRYLQADAEVKQMASVVTAFFGIIAAVGLSIIFLINLFALRERKYEIGVLRAIGMPKMKVVALLVGEMLILSILGMIAAIIIGIFVNPSVVDYMMKLEMNHELPSALKAAVSTINSAISPIVILELLASTSVLVLIAGSATIGSIMRFDPTQILAERN